MKILALNSSPRRGGQSKTEMMLHHLVEGMQDAGAEVTIVNLRGKKIKYCLGCFSCWAKSPGKCIQDDDMTGELFPKWLESDLAVYATPLYNYAVNASLKAFIERTIPALEPFFEIQDGRMYHPVRQKSPGAVLLSVSGMPDRDHFNAMSNHVNYFFASPGRQLIAEIYRPCAEAMTIPFLQEISEDILDATVQAGRDLVKSMKISPEIMERITQPIVDPESFVKMGNLYWKNCINERVTPKEFQEKNMIIRPDSLENFMFFFPFGLNPQVVEDKKIRLQFNFSGDVEDSCYFTIEKNNISSDTGAANEPDIIIDTPFDLWMDIMTLKKDGQKMFMEEKYKVTGDISLMIELFSKNKE